MIEEAHSLAASLRSRPTGAERVSSAGRDALRLRNRIFNMLFERMSAVRAAAQFVFRDRPDIVREATSAYQRRRRAAQRRAAKAKKPVDDAVTPTV